MSITYTTRRFNIVAQYNRRRGNSFEVVWTRYYSKLENAMKRGQELIMQGGVGDVIEFYLVTNKMHVGWMRMPANGNVTSSWNLRSGVDNRASMTSLVRRSIEDLTATATRAGLSHDDLIKRVKESLELTS
jgi:hypothetical protein